jgi:hypothetical protein
MKKNETARVELTPEQKAQPKKETAKEAETVELTVEQLEERVAPFVYQ